MHYIIMIIAIILELDSICRIFSIVYNNPII